MDSFVNGPYLKLLKLNINYRYASLALGLIALLLTIGVVKNGLIKFTFMPEVDGDKIKASIHMNEGVSIDETSKVADLVLEKGLETVAEFNADRAADDGILRNIYSVVGGTIAGGGPGGGATATATNLSNISMFLTESEQRGIPAAEISNIWRNKVPELPGVDSITFQSTLVHLGANIDVLLAHQDFSALEKASDRIRAALAEYQGVSDIEDSYSRGKREIKLKLKPEARTLGITERDLARQVRAAFYGAEALRIQRGRNEIKVMVRYPDADRVSSTTLRACGSAPPREERFPFFRPPRSAKALVLPKSTELIANGSSMCRPASMPLRPALRRSLPISSRMCFPNWLRIILA